MTQTFPCPACGAPNEPEDGVSHMACSYCGANLTIPKTLRTQARPKVESTFPKARPTPRLEKEAPDLLRKAQPVAIKAWNAYAYWTWLRWLAPACLTVFVIIFLACLALGALPFMLRLIQ